MIAGYVAYAASFVVAGLTPGIGRRVARAASGRFAPFSVAWRCGVGAAELLVGAAAMVLMLRLHRWANPGAEVIAGVICLLLLAAASNGWADEVDGQTVLARAIGRARGDQALLEAADKGDAVRRAIVFGGVERVIGAVLGLIGWHVASVLD